MSSLNCRKAQQLKKHRRLLSYILHKITKIIALAPNCFAPNRRFAPIGLGLLDEFYLYAVHADTNT